MIFLETPRLVLRNVEEQDEAVMFDYRNDIRCSRYQRGQKRARHQIRELIGRRKDDVLSDQANCMVAIALRETGEELGISVDEIEVLGRLDFIAHRANFIMYPVLARIPKKLLSQMKPNPAEVGETFLVPVDYLLDNPPQEYTYSLIPDTPEDFPYELIGIPKDYRWQRGGETVPVYPWPGHTIWGLTGRITRHLTGWLERWQRCTPNN